MSCKTTFYSNAVIALDTFMDFICYKTGKNLEIIKPIIEDYIVFEMENHKGSIKPSYYRDGIPSMDICTKCKEEIT